MTNEKIATALIVLLAVAGGLRANPIEELDGHVKLETIDERTWAIANALGEGLRESCDGSNSIDNPMTVQDFASKLSQEDSEEYDCATSMIRRGREPILSMIMQAEDNDQNSKDEVGFYKQVSDHKLHSKGHRLVVYLVYDSIEACQSYISESSKNTGEQDRDAKFLLALNACKLLVKNGVGTQAMQTVSKIAANKYRDATRARESFPVD